VGAIVGSYLVLVDSFQKTKNRGKGGERGGKEASSRAGAALGINYH
jgi:hypothetical protein